MGDEYYNDDRVEEDDGFEDSQPGGLRPNYKIPILLCEMAEEVLDEIIESENNGMSCAGCGIKLTSFVVMKEHEETCSGEPKHHSSEYQISQYHTNLLVLTLKNMYKVGTSGLSPLKTDTRLPFHMEPFAGSQDEHHDRLVGNLAIVTCRMCNCQYIHKSHDASPSGHNGAVVSDVDEEVDPSMIKFHVKLCPEYGKVHEEFMKTMMPFIEKIRFHFDKLFDIYKIIRSSIYGACFKIREPTDPFTWREMGTIYEVDESNRNLICEYESKPKQFQYFDFKLHNIEPETVDFIRTDYFSRLSETLDKLFFTRVTGL